MLRISDIINVLEMEQAIEAGGGKVRNPTPNPMGLEDRENSPMGFEDRENDDKPKSRKNKKCG